MRRLMDKKILYEEKKCIIRAKKKKERKKEEEAKTYINSLNCSMVNKTEEKKKK